MFSAREDYGLRAALDLAMHANAGPAQTHEIAQRQDIPEAYLNQILVALRRAGLVNSLRGASGGYVLAKPPTHITAGDIIRALRGEILSVPSSADSAEPSAVGQLWSEVKRAVEAVLDSVTLNDLLDNQRKIDLGLSYMANI
ncbi:MAG: RrF2 family transcriptional regulator [Armatimonadota bacterium]